MTPDVDSLRTALEKSARLFHNASRGKPDMPFESCSNSACVEARAVLEAVAEPVTPEPHVHSMWECGKMRHVSGDHWMDEPCHLTGPDRCKFEPYRLTRLDLKPEPAPSEREAQTWAQKRAELEVRWSGKGLSPMSAFEMAGAVYRDAQWDNTEPDDPNAYDRRGLLNLVAELLDRLDRAGSPEAQIDVASWEDALRQALDTGTLMKITRKAITASHGVAVDGSAIRDGVVGAILSEPAVRRLARLAAATPESR